MYKKHGKRRFRCRKTTKVGEIKKVDLNLIQVNSEEASTMAEDTFKKGYHIMNHFYQSHKYVLFSLHFARTLLNLLEF